MATAIQNLIKQAIFFIHMNQSTYTKFFNILKAEVTKGHSWKIKLRKNLKEKFGYTLV